MATGLLLSFVAAVQASLSVILVIFYGALAAKLSLLNSANGKAISKICVQMFLPLLLLVQIGSELHLESAHRYGIILAWAIICHIISFVIGIVGHVVLGFPDWITAAIMFNNTTSYPLLLIQSLDQTGILKTLIVEDESTKAAIERAKSYFLVFATVSSCLTFAIGPRLIDSEHAPEADSSSVEDETSNGNVTVAATDIESGSGNTTPTPTSPVSPTERSRLLPPRRKSHHQRHTSITFFPSQPKFASLPRRPFYIPRPKWKDFSPRAQWWLLFLHDFVNAPLVGAVLGAIIGLTPALHRAFFNDAYSGGFFTAWLTDSWKNVGGLFVPLPLIVAGISLYTSYKESKQPSQAQCVSSKSVPWFTTLFILVIRFVIWPVFSIGVIYAIVKKAGRHGVLGSDPMLWFTMMIMPTGPPAMKLITMVQVSDAGADDERQIAKILTISYIISPLLAFTVVGALNASRAAIGV